MAWLQNLAGKAEDFLNKIDQNAATVLNEPNQPVQPTERGTHHAEVETEQVATIVQEENEITKISRASTPKSYISQPHDESKSTSEAEEDANIIPESAFFNIPSYNQLEEQAMYEDKIAKLETENSNMNRSLLNAQHLYSELENEYSNLKLEYERASESAEEARVKMETYKARAQRILHEKETLISVKEKSGEDIDQAQILKTYNDELKKELQFQHDRNEELAGKVTQLNKDLAHLQQQYISVQMNNQQSVQSLQQVLNSERNIRSGIEEELKSKNNEIKQLKIELTTRDIKFKNTEAEVVKLKEQIRSTPRETNEDLELRIQSLTNTLMSKQNTLETLTCEKNALKIQLEKTNEMNHDLLTQKAHAIVKITGRNDTDDAKSQVPRMLQVSPLDRGVTRRMKHAYSTLDMIGIRTGAFLRRYPVARAFLICYMMLLHVWVLFILLTYIPSNR